MKRNSLKLILSAAIFLLPAMSLQAALDTVLNVDLIGYYQAKIAVVGDTQAGQVGNFRVNANQLLALIGQEKGIRFPKGSHLMVSASGEVYVAAADGTNILDAGEFLQVNFYDAQEVLQGKINTTNGSEDSVKYYSLVLKLNFVSARGTLRGVAIERTLAALPNKYGIQVTNGSTISSVNGRGIINGGAGFFEGKINLTGRSVTIP